MHDPPHPGAFIAEVCPETNGSARRELAATLRASPSTPSRLLSGASGAGPEMALRPAKALGRSSESWLAMQAGHDVWQARKRVKLDTVSKARLTTACMLVP
jgi:addiction module HigA family antidote